MPVIAQVSPTSSVSPAVPIGRSTVSLVRIRAAVTAPATSTAGQSTNRTTPSKRILSTSSVAARAGRRKRATSQRAVLLAALRRSRSDESISRRRDEGAVLPMSRKGVVSMSKLRLTMSMSLDGFVAGPDQSESQPLGIGGEQLHEWLVPLKAFRESHGGEGGEVNASTPIAEGILGGTGATIMGRNMFGGGPGRWDDAWRGYWGEDPPYHHPVFVLTHHTRDALEMEGGTTFNFVTTGIEPALEQARAAAGDKDVSLGGGADVVQQYLAAGLLDELLISIVPVLLGGGARLLDNLGDALPRFEQIEAIEAPGVTHIRYAAT